ADSSRDEVDAPEIPQITLPTGRMSGRMSPAFGGGSPPPFGTVELATSPSAGSPVSAAIQLTPRSFQVCPACSGIVRREMRFRTPAVLVQPVVGGIIVAWNSWEMPSPRKLTSLTVPHVMSWPPKTAARDQPFVGFDGERL